MHGVDGCLHITDKTSSQAAATQTHRFRDVRRHTAVLNKLLFFLLLLFIAQKQENIDNTSKVRAGQPD